MSAEAKPSAAPQIAIAEPRFFTTSAVLASSAYGVVLFLPVLLAVLIVSSVPFGIHSLLIPLIVIAITTFFLPFGFGNLSIRRWVRDQKSEGREQRPEDGFVVQLTFSPRIRSGLRAVIEDADDVGLLGLSKGALNFQGDSISLSVPFGNIAEVRSKNVGWRGLFLTGGRVIVRISGLPDITELQFAERSSCILPVSRMVTRELYERIKSVTRPGSQ